MSLLITIIGNKRFRSFDLQCCMSIIKSERNIRTLPMVGQVKLSWKWDFSISCNNSGKLNLGMISVNRVRAQENLVLHCKWRQSRWKLGFFSWTGMKSIRQERGSVKSTYVAKQNLQLYVVRTVLDVMWQKLTSKWPWQNCGNGCRLIVWLLPKSSIFSKLYDRECLVWLEMEQ